MKALLLVALLATAACTDNSSARTPPVAPPSDHTVEPVAAGLRIDLQTEPGDGERELLVGVRVLDDNGGGPGYRIEYGDGLTDEVQLPIADCPAPVPGASPPPPRPLDELVEKRHRYARAGTYTVKVTITSQLLCSPVPTEIACAGRPVTIK